MYRVFSLVICIVWVITLSTESLAQRGRRKSPPQLSSSTLQRESEFYFTEGEKYYILEDYVNALINFQKSSSIDSENSAAYYKIAQIEFINEEYAKALRDATLAKEKEPDNKYYRLLIIDIQTQSGQLEEAAQSYESLISEIPGLESYMYELAAIRTFQGKREEAIEVYNRLEKALGFSDRVAYERHKLLDSMGDKKAAMDELAKLVEKYPRTETYVIALAEYFLSIDKDSDALKVLEEFLTLQPENANASLLAGEIHRKNKEFKKAEDFLGRAFQNPALPANLKVQLIAQYRTVPASSALSDLVNSLCQVLLDVHPDEANVHSVYGDFLREKNDLEGAIAEYKKSLKLDDSNFNVWQNLIILLSQKNEFNAVILEADQALEIFPNNRSLYYFSGYAHVRLKMYQEAVVMLKNGMRLVSNDPQMKSDINELLGEAYNGTKQYVKSDAAYDAVLEHNQNNYHVLNNYSYYLALRNDQLDKAERMSAKLVRDNPDNATFLDTHAWVLFKLGKYKEAKKVIERAVASNEAKATHIEHYGDILFKLGQTNEAVINWEKAKKMDSNLKLIDKKITDRKFYEK